MATPPAPTGTPAPGLFDGQGCLTPLALSRVAAAPPGRAPAALAAHLAACGRCQRRLLASGAPAAGARRTRPPLWRTLAVAAGGVLLLLMAFAMAQWLTSSPP